MNPKQVRIARLMRPLWGLLGGLFSKPVEEKDPKSILIFDFHLIGDVVLLTPLLRAVREGYPEARITLVAGPWAQDILKGAGWVDEIVHFSAPWVKYGQGWRGWWKGLSLVKRLRKRSWDLGIEVRGDVRQILMLAMTGARRRCGYDLTGGGNLLTDIVPLPSRGTKHFAAEYHRNICKYLGVWEDENREYIPQLMLTEDELEIAEKIPEFIGIHFGASVPLRRPPNALMLAFIDELARAQGGPVVIYKVKEEPGTAALLADRLIGKYKIDTEIWEGSLRDFIVHVSRAKKLYCLDSGPAHIAAALGVAVTVIYGPSIVDVTRPLGQNVKIVEGLAVPCRPCDQRHCVARHYQECFPPVETWV